MMRETRSKSDIPVHSVRVFGALGLLAFLCLSFFSLLKTPDRSPPALIESV